MSGKGRSIEEELAKAREEVSHLKRRLADERFAAGMLHPLRVVLLHCRGALDVREQEGVVAGGWARLGIPFHSVGDGFF